MSVETNLDAKLRCSIKYDVHKIFRELYFYFIASHICFIKLLYSKKYK